MANVADLQSKYSKLAQEYSKLRAQNQVLKKAVVDEQTASCSLKDELKQKEQSSRKVEQEMDSLSFRNQQLTKRVELLQEELLLSESKSKKSKVIIHTHADCSIHDIFHLLNLTKPLCTY
ncbi:protein phosphatase 1 regulatory subunit 21-like [Sinocyclocheilus grahami]|uniref:protein phosphatase 1 regulatory subunit 21-like n=1 Tax=Sinocyclocheilus grahami TaxID=75366 RepID=UPI0007AC7DD5|nr:PREDICTED: protein phosphatase 1 regulatory subunit 21-like [Sinocyclocheilus grahami]